MLSCQAQENTYSESSTTFRILLDYAIAVPLCGSRIIGISIFAAGVVGVRVTFRKWQMALKALNQIRVGNEWCSKRNQVRSAFSQNCIAAFLREAQVCHQPTAIIL